MDDDIWFWHQWAEAGKTLYCDPLCSIGHLQVMVSQFNDDMNAEYPTPEKWRERNKP